MEIKQIELFNGFTKYVDLFLDERASTSRYILRSAEGLTPDDVVSDFTAKGLVSGYDLYSFTLPPREITLNIGLNPRPEFNETAASLRENLYKMIGPSRTGAIQIRFLNEQGIVEANIYGRVSKFESDLTANKSFVQITFYCETPHLVGPEVTVNTSGLSKTAPVITDDLSTAQHGFKLHVKFTGSVSFFEINAGTDAPFKVTYAFAVNDILYISTEQEDRYLHVYDASLGSTVYLASAMSLNSVWPVIFPGVNAFTVNTSAYTWELFTYRPRYWGI
jgi:hypothetical protein